MKISEIIATMDRLNVSSESESISPERFYEELKDEVEKHLNTLGYTIIPDYFMTEEDIHCNLPGMAVTVAFKTVVDGYLPTTFYKVERFALPGIFYIPDSDEDDEDYEDYGLEDEDNNVLFSLKGNKRDLLPIIKSILRAGERGQVGLMYWLHTKEERRGGYYSRPKMRPSDEYVLEVRIDERGWITPYLGNLSKQ